MNDTSLREICRENKHRSKEGAAHFAGQHHNIIKKKIDNTTRIARMTNTERVKVVSLAPPEAWGDDDDDDEYSSDDDDSDDSITADDLDFITREFDCADVNDAVDKTCMDFRDAIYSRGFFAITVTENANNNNSSYTTGNRAIVSNGRAAGETKEEEAENVSQASRPTDEGSVCEDAADKRQSDWSLSDFFGKFKLFGSDEGQFQGTVRVWLRGVNANQLGPKEHKRVEKALLESWKVAVGLSGYSVVSSKFLPKKGKEKKDSYYNTSDRWDDFLSDLTFMKVHAPKGAVARMNSLGRKTSNVLRLESPLQLQFSFWVSKEGESKTTVPLMKLWEAEAFEALQKELPRNVMSCGKGNSRNKDKLSALEGCVIRFETCSIKTQGNNDERPQSDGWRTEFARSLLRYGNNRASGR